MARGEGRPSDGEADGPSVVDERFGDLAAALAGRPGVTVGTRGRGFGSGALQVEGRIFAMVSRNRVVLKLPARRVVALVGDGDGEPFDAGKGQPMREWVVLGDHGSDQQWHALALEALAFVAGRSRDPGGPPVR